MIHPCISPELSLHRFPFKHSSGFHDLTGLSSIRTVWALSECCLCVLCPQHFHSGVRSVKTKLSHGFEHNEGISKCIPHSPEWFSAEQHQTASLIVQYFWGPTFFGLFNWPQCFYIHRHLVCLFYMYECTAMNILSLNMIIHTSL